MEGQWSGPTSSPRKASSKVLMLRLAGLLPGRGSSSGNGLAGIMLRDPIISVQSVFVEREIQCFIRITLQIN
jgi:hypothetical protein